MYKIIEKETGYLLDEIVSPLWVKQQRRVDFPISVETYEDADGLVLSDGDTIVGIAGRNMENYEPLVEIQVVDSNPYLFNEFKDTKYKIREVNENQESTKELVMTDMQGLVDVFSLQYGNQNLVLDTMQGLTDVFLAVSELQAKIDKLQGGV